MKERLSEFIEELKYNQNINIEKGLENRVDIDYIIERLDDILLESLIGKEEENVELSSNCRKN